MTTKPGKGTAPQPSGKFRWSGFFLLCGIYLAVAALWHTWAVYPLKLFVVLLHETSHGIAALASGGRIERIDLSRELGGACTTAGGSPLFITAAGYVGSLLFGAAFLLTGTRTRFSSHLSVATGVLVMLIAIRYIPPGSFGRHAAIAMGALLALLATTPRPVPEFAMRVLGITSCLYAFLDVKGDVLDRDHPMSDASRLAALTGVPSVLWGILWCGISVVTAAVAAKWAVTGPFPADERNKET